MNKESYDIAILGGGAIGLVAGERAASLGKSICIIEEHQEIGYPVKCSGLFSVRGVKELFPDLPRELICSVIRGGRFYSPSNLNFLAYSEKEKGYAVERKLFDKFLARKAARKGAEIKLKTVAEGAEIKSNEVRIKVNELGEEKIIKAKLGIDASGGKAILARWLGIRNKKSFVGAAQIEVEAESIGIEEDIAEVYFSKKFAPGFYAWILPKGYAVEVGLACGGKEQKFNARDYLKLFIKKHEVAKRKIKAKSILEYNEGAIPVGKPVRSYGERLLIIGDAASQVKASTGGGVITGSICARIAAEAACRAIDENDFSERFFRENYEKAWKKAIGKELLLHAYLRKIFNAASDKSIDRLFSIAISEGLPELMSKYDNTDIISGFLKEVFSRRKILSWLKQIAR